MGNKQNRSECQSRILLENQMMEVDGNLAEFSGATEK